MIVLSKDSSNKTVFAHFLFIQISIKILLYLYISSISLHIKIKCEQISLQDQTFMSVSLNLLSYEAISLRRFEFDHSTSTVPTWLSIGSMHTQYKWEVELPDLLMWTIRPSKKNGSLKQYFCYSSSKNHCGTALQNPELSRMDDRHFLNGSTGAYTLIVSRFCWVHTYHNSSCSNLHRSESGIEWTDRSVMNSSSLLSENRMSNY